MKVFPFHLQRKFAASKQCTKSSLTKGVVAFNMTKNWSMTARCKMYVEKQFNAIIKLMKEAQNDSKTFKAMLFSHQKSIGGINTKNNNNY